MTWVIVATVVAGAVSANAQRNAGKAQEIEYEKQAEQEKLSAEGRELTRRQQLNKVLSANIVSLADSGMSGEGTPESISLESAKQAFLVRDSHVTDPAYMDVDPAEFFTDAALDELAAAIDTTTALPWPQPAKPGDTVWLGAIDAAGNAVSFIQSIYWEFGSGLVLPQTGVLWQNRS